jgi:hypothetical protein
VRSRREDAETAVEVWNLQCPRGTAVTVERDNGLITHTKTRSMAWVMPNDIAVVQLEGIAGCYALERVTIDHGGKDAK